MTRAKEISKVITAPVLSGLTYPTTDGSANQFMKTDGSGTLSFATVDFTALSATNLTSGTVPDARITGAYTGITNLTVNGTGTSNFTSTATSPVQINGTSIPTLTIRNSTTPVELQMRATTGEGLVRTSTNHPLVFAVNASERMRIDGSGKIGIGTSVAPAQKLTVTGVSGANVGGLTNGILSLTTGTGAITDTRMLFGIVDDNYAWIQPADYGVAYRNLILNPNGGNVGINSSNPSAKLTVEGTFSVRTSSSQAFNDSNNANNLTMNDSIAHFNVDGADKDFKVSSDTVNHALFVQGSTGNVGVAHSNPDQKLTVNGHINLPTGNSYFYGAGHNVFQVDSTRTYFYGGTNGVQIRKSDNSTALIAVDDSGYMTQSKLPMFQIGGTTTVTTTTTGVLRYTTANVFNSTTEYDPDNLFNGANGRFTAPVSGRYFFILSIGVSFTSGYHIHYIRKNGASLAAFSRNQQQDSDTDIQVIQGIIDLSAGDYVTAERQNNYATGYVLQPMFCGFLLG